MDYYDILGVKRSASADELKTAYKRQAMKNHPDKGGNPEKFKQINEAYQALSDPQQKQMYDKFGTTDPQQAQMNSGGFHFTSGSRADFDDILRHFGFGAHFGQGFANQRMPKNKDIKIGYEIEFVDVFTGKSDTISYKLPNGKIEFLEIKIPPGIRHGDNIKFQGYGDHSIQSLPRGDLIMQVRIRPNPKFRREHNDVYTQSTVDVFDLIVGTKHDLKTPDNKNISLTIPPGTTPNTVFSVAGHGIPDISTNKRGNFFVEVKCKIPKYDKHTIEKIKQFRAKNI